MDCPPLKAVFGLSLSLAATAAAQPIDFSAQIRPLLNQSCTSCHGGVKAAGEISFVYREAVTKVGKKSGRPVIVPGRPEESELIARITSTDKEYRMPPAEHGPALAPEKIALLREWIRQGAVWQDHWAFMPPKSPAVPVLGKAAIGNQSQPSNQSYPPDGSRITAPPIADYSSPIDAFVRARLAKVGLAPSPEGTRAAWLRRASLDLTGLPPTPEESAAFAGEVAAGAFERQADRLLASPRFGERWASLWLDLARYADSKGYEKDDHRNVWQYRDWLIGAFNRNLPYDRFIIEQLAGDLLPGATIEQHVATAFHRQTQVNDEGGTDDEEYRLAAVIDRVATTWQVANAVTFNCVQCHAHPYDPIRHQEFYRFAAFFNSTRDADLNNEHPTLRVPHDPARNGDAWRLRREVEALRHEVVAAGQKLEAAVAWQPAPIVAARAQPEASVVVRDGALEADGTLAANVRYELSLPVLALSGEPITALRFEARPVEPAKAAHTPERGFIITQIQIALSSPEGIVTPIEVGRYFPDTENFTTIATKTLPKPVVAGGEKAAGESRKAEGVAPKAAKRAGKAAATKAAASKAGGPAAAADEVREVTLDFHFAANPTISGARWLVAALREPIVAPAGSTIHVTVMHSRQITEKPAPTRRLRVGTSGDARWNDLARDPAIARQVARVSEAIAELAKIPGTDLPVMAELAARERRETRLFVRGNFLEKTGADLAPGVPELFPPLPQEAPANRLTLARWFFQPGQPLTARVAVNRFWEQMFGIGIVATLEDFGSAGDKPSHPELLDWLALRFERDLKWDMKALLKEIVLSATYRQESKVRPELLERDPQNRLLARGPRQRLTAEMVRDQALHASGLLSAKMGGAPVMPPQPAGVWQTVYSNKTWDESKGEDRHRRAVYTFWKRSAAYPGFLSFDMPARDLCTARRTPTNTPLQALVTLNDIVYHEAAAALAARVKREIADGSVEARIARAFDLVVSRRPMTTETARLRKLYDASLAAAAAVVPAKGAASPGQSSESRALHDVAAAIINLDAAFVR